MKYFLALILLCSTASLFADRLPSNRGYGDLFFREPPGQPRDDQRHDRRTINVYPDYYYGSPGYYYPSYPSSDPGYDPFPDATRARSIFEENVKK